MIYFTGDIHGAVDGIADFINKIHPTMEDVIVLLGDVGANYYTGRRDNLLKAFLNDAGTVFLCIHGNHERRPTTIPGYAHQRQKARRRLRRGTSIRKADRLLRIINYGGYAPHRGYIDWGFSGRTLLHTGKYIKYPKNSNCQRWIKRETSLRIRRCRDVPAKGNYYRRLFDYWWTLY